MHGKTKIRILKTTIHAEFVDQCSVKLRIFIREHSEGKKVAYCTGPETTIVCKDIKQFATCAMVAICDGAKDGTIGGMLRDYHNSINITTYNRVANEIIKKAGF